MEKAAYVIDPENADEIMDVVNHPPSEDSSTSSSRTPSPAGSARPRKRAKLSCPSYLRLPSWSGKEKNSRGNLDVHEVQTGKLAEIYRGIFSLVYFVSANILYQIVFRMAHVFGLVSLMHAPPEMRSDQVCLPSSVFLRKCYIIFQ